MNECWIFQGCITPGRHGGYGRATVTTAPGVHKQMYVHRLVYEALVGPLVSGEEIDHLCANRACYNPTHLESVLHVVNQRRRGSARRAATRGLDPLWGSDAPMW